MKTSPELRELFGPIGQIGYVVTDLMGAAQQWTDTIGIGPWTIFERAAFDEYRYEGEPAEIEIGVALAFMGDVQIELIQPLDDAPSMYREMLDTFGDGAQHICFYPDDYEAAIAAGIDAGMTVGQDGSIWGIDFAYLRGAHGQVLELARLSERRRAGRDAAIAEAATWDGTDPLRLR
ncbi:MAG: VOC family protein [Actinomycetota bacterium]